ncbi:MAG: phosphohydrolase [Opitutus sp.]|nr:phosphohydrolase [Opitutus sp.]
MMSWIQPESRPRSSQKTFRQRRGAGGEGRIHSTGAVDFPLSSLGFGESLSAARPSHWHANSWLGPARHPMKILAVSDLHFGLGQFDWIAQQAKRYELVIIAGDLHDIAGHLDLDSQITIVVKYLRTISAKTRLLVCSGNHDGDERNAAQEYVARWLQRVRAAGLVVDGAGADIGGLRVSVCPWWDGPASRKAMQEFLRREAGLAPKTWLWIHHAPPDQVGVSWTGKVHAGDAFLVHSIRELRPTFVVSGHIHNSPFRSGGAWASRIGSTWTFNAGRQLGVPPAYIEFDLAQHSARWVSQAGIEDLQLDTAAPPDTPQTETPSSP